MLNFLRRQVPQSDLIGSKLYSQDDFYPAFLKDLGKCQHEVIVESPFVTNRRLSMLLPALEKLKSRKVKLVINTRDPETQDDEYLRSEARRACLSCSIWAFTCSTPPVTTGSWPYWTDQYSTRGRSTFFRKMIAPKLCGESNRCN